jgi:hypothetical protein
MVLPSFARHYTTAVKTAVYRTHTLELVQDRHGQVLPHLQT